MRQVYFLYVWLIYQASAEFTILVLTIDIERLEDQSQGRPSFFFGEGGSKNLN